MALSKNTPTTVLEGKLQAYGLYRALHPYEGSMIFRKSDGYACLTAAGNPFLGHAYAEANNAAGGDGDLEVFVRTGRYFAKATISGIAIADVGKMVYASDDGTLTLTASGNSLVGQVVKYVTTSTCIVQFQPVAIGQTAITDAPAGGTGAAAGAWATSTDRDTAIAAINACTAALRAAGIIKTS
jgi:hypothetical protein